MVAACILYRFYFWIFHAVQIPIGNNTMQSKQCYTYNLSVCIGMWKLLIHTCDIHRFCLHIVVGIAKVYLTLDEGCNKLLLHVNEYVFLWHFDWIVTRSIRMKGLKTNCTHSPSKHSLCTFIILSIYGCGMSAMPIF